MYKTTVDNNYFVNMSYSHGRDHIPRGISDVTVIYYILFRMKNKNAGFVARISYYVILID